ncbi:MAG: outer membrane protein assembly factor BamE [Oceanospirillaceae bacterium]|nr:outer membrane protein assembly factor BamE [Oceanospirillaceae bacterium]
MRKFLLLTTAAILLSGCTQFPGVYKLDIPQGNIITQEKVNQLRPGMTPRQVQYIMGTPIIADTFNADRWDYIYTMKKPNQTPTNTKVTVFFSNGVLANIKGDLRPQ